MKNKIVKTLAMVTLGTMAMGCFASAETKDSGIVVGWLQKNQTNYFETVINGGGEELLEELKADGTVSEYYLMDGQTDASTQVTQAQDLINLGIDVCIIQPAEADGSAPVITLMNEAGIPVIEVNSLTSNADEAAGFSGSDDVEAGEIMANYIIDTCGETGGYCHLQGIIGNTAAINRTQGIHNVMDEQEGWTMLDEQSAEWAADKAAQFVNDWINLYGDELTAIISDNDDMSVAAKTACIAAGREDIVCIGVDANDAALAMIATGEGDASVFQNGHEQGRKAVEMAIAVVKGEEINSEYIPFELVTAENIDDYYTAE